MNNDFHHNADFESLLERVLNGEASPGELKSFNEALASDKDARRRYMEMQMFDAALDDEVSAAGGERLESSGEAVIFERSTSVTKADQVEGKASNRRAFKYYAAAAMLVLAAVLAVLFSTGKQVFEVISVEGVKGDNFSQSEKWIDVGERIVLGEGSVVEFKSSDGNRFALKGTAELLVEGREQLSLERGSLWAELDGEPVRISVPNGEIMDIGTILGVFVDEEATTRLDVFHGKARMASVGDVNRAKVLAAGESLLLEGLDWHPLLGSADSRFYATTTPTRLGINFITSEAEGAFIQSSRPYSANWQNLMGSHGTVRLADSPVRATWVGAHTWGRGESDTPEAAISSGGLTTKSWRPAEVEAAQSYGFQRVKSGAVVRFSNLSEWLKRSQAKRYRLTLFCNIVNSPEMPFSPIRFYADSAMSGRPIYQWNPQSENLETLIRRDRGPGREYYIKEIEYDFSGDSFVIYFPSGAERTHVSAIMLSLVK